MKKILYINQYFKHPSEPGSTRSYWIARRLVEAGYEVTMLAQRNLAHSHIKEPPWFEVKDVDGIRVIYLRNRYSNEMTVPARAWAFLSFMFRATIRAVREKDVDLVIATSTPLTVAVPALFRKWLRKTPFIFEVRDLWPEVPIQMGAVRNRWAIKFLRWFEKTTYRNAVRVVALSPGMRDGVEKYVPAGKTAMIPNMAKIDQFWLREPNKEMIASMGLREDSFKVLYFGQMGISNALHYIVDAAAILEREALDIEFVFVGHGKVKKEVEERAKREGLRSVHVFDRFPMKEISEIVNFCHVSLVTFTNLPILYTNSPNKLFDSLSAGKPVVVNSPGWTREMVETHECGFYVDPERPQDLANRIRELKENPELSKRLGENARRLAETRYDKSILCEEFSAVVDKVWAEAFSCQ